MIDLFDISGLPLKLDTENLRLVYDADFDFENEEKIAISDIVPTLLNKYIKYPEVVYYHHKCVNHKINAIPKDNLSFDIITIPYGLLGIEYIRTHLYYSEYEENKFDSIVEVFNGKLTVFMQKNQVEEDDLVFEKTVEQTVIIDLYPGEKLAIPTGFYYTFVNTDNETVVFSKFARKNHETFDYNQIKKERGLAYYIISKNARIEIVANPKYKILSKPSNIRVNDWLDSTGYNCEHVYNTNSKLVEIVSSNYDKLREILSY